MDLSPKTLIKILEAKGFELVRIKGSHHYYRHPETHEAVPVPVHWNKDLWKGLFLAILKKVGADISDTTKGKL